MKTHQPETTLAPKDHSTDSANSFAPPAFQLFSNDSVLQRESESSACGVTSPKWEEFAVGFNDKFASVLHAFKQEQTASEGESASTTPTKVSNKPGGQSGEFLPPETLSCYFTIEQRDKLINYFTSNVIPDRLFNGDDAGPTSASQRILMSSIILSNGVYSPGSFMQRVHARFCGHWVKLTWHYAGVTPSGNMEWAGVSGNLDHDGNIVIGNGKHESEFSGRKSRTYLDKASEEERDKLTPEGTGFTDAYKGASEERKGKFQRYGEMPFDDFDKIQGGDWLYYFNGNSSASGNHSVIFSRWASTVQEKDGVRYRTAIVFSQGSPKRGGKEHTVNLGESFRGDDPKIRPVTNVNRVADGAQPADSVADVLGGTMSEGTELNKSNKSYQKLFKRRHKSELDINLLRESLRKENKTLIDELAALDGERLTDGQEGLLRAANQEENVENLVRLTQRLRTLTTSVRKHDANREQKFVTGKAAIKGRRKRVAGLNEKYDTNHAESEAKLAELKTQLDEVDAEMGPTRTDVERLEGKIDELGFKSEIKGITARLNASWVELKQYKPRTPERNAIMKERKELIARRKELRASAKGNKAEVAVLEKELRPLKKKIRPLERKRAQIEKKQAAVQATDPWGYAHTGNNKTGVDKRYKFSGNIETVRSYKSSGDLKVVASPVGN